MSSELNSISWAREVNRAFLKIRFATTATVIGVHSGLEMVDGDGNPELAAFHEAHPSFMNKGFSNRCSSAYFQGSGKVDLAKFLGISCQSFQRHLLCHFPEDFLQFNFVET